MAWQIPTPSSLLVPRPNSSTMIKEVASTFWNCVSTRVCWAGCICQILQQERNGYAHMNSSREQGVVILIGSMLRATTRDCDPIYCGYRCGILYFPRILQEIRAVLVSGSLAVCWCGHGQFLDDHRLQCMTPVAALHILTPWGNLVQLIRNAIS